MLSTWGTLGYDWVLDRVASNASSILNYDVEEMADLADVHWDILLCWRVRRCLSVIDARTSVLSGALTLFGANVFIFNCVIVRNILLWRFCLLVYHLRKSHLNALQLHPNF